MIENDKVIRVKHINGYSGILYGNHSMSIKFNKKEILHTGSRTINTREELYEFLEKMPEFDKMLNDSFDDLIKENCEVEE